MGVLNLTPDSFSDGGKYNKKNGRKHAKKLIKDGANIIDIGGEATNPGSKDVNEKKNGKEFFQDTLKIKKKKFLFH